MASADPVVPQALPSGYVLSEKKTHADFTKPIESSLNDDRLYRLIRLNNDLEVLLIQDPTVDKSAAALDVHVGHLSDPVSLDSLPVAAVDGHGLPVLALHGCRKGERGMQVCTALALALAHGAKCALPRNLSLSLLFGPHETMVAQGYSILQPN